LEILASIDPLPKEIAETQDLVAQWTPVRRSSWLAYESGHSSNHWLFMGMAIRDTDRVIARFFESRIASRMAGGIKSPAVFETISKS
jgi:hypothetical protein